MGVVAGKKLEMGDILPYNLLQYHLKFHEHVFMFDVLLKVIYIYSR